MTSLIASHFHSRFFILTLFALISTHLQAQNKKEIKVLKETLVDMKIIPKDNLLGKSYNLWSQLKMAKKDTNLLNYLRPLKFDFETFLLSDHEVTNAEYREFVLQVSDSNKGKFSTPYIDRAPVNYTYINSKGEETMLDIFPDLEVWNKDFINVRLDGMVENYASNTVFNDYPVVGINVNQAMAFIHWRNVHLSKLLEQMGIAKEDCFFRIPTEAEWIYSAYSIPKLEKKRKNYEYPIEIKLLDDKRQYKANFGSIKDKNNLIVKDFRDDGFPYTSLVKSYKSNDYGIFDLAGNVAEYVDSNIPFEQSLFEMKSIAIDSFFNSSVFESFYQFFLNRLTHETTKNISIDSVNLFKETFLFNNSDATQYGALTNELQQLHSIIIRDFEIIQRHELPVLAKGGSWFDGLVYLTPHLNQVFDSKKGNSRTGFRLAMTMDEKLMKLLFN
jgi:formylglycine-generating enzyme required for sulfatase activity